MLRAAALVLLSAVLVAVVAGCGDAPKPVTPAVLDGTDWASTSVEGRDLAKGSKLTLAFENDLLSASAGCNSINGKYSVNGGVLKQHDQFQTQMACVGIGDQETWFAGFLAAGAKVMLLEHTLTLSRGDVKAVFERAKPGPGSTRAGSPAPVVGTKWTLLSSTPRGGPTTDAPAGPKAPTLELSEDGKAAIFTGCNRGGGEATFADGFVTFGPVITTQIACEPDVMELERAVLKVLDGKVAAGFSEDNLSLAKDGNQLLYTAR